MSPLFETIRIENKQARNLAMHQDRAVRSQKVLFPDFAKIDLNIIYNDILLSSSAIWPASILRLYFS